MSEVGAGYYARTLVTRLGKLVLRVPQDRARAISDGGVRAVLEEREGAGVGMAEKYVQEVSTRKVKGFTEELCGHEFSSTISRVAGRLDDKLERFTRRPLEENYRTECWKRVRADRQEPGERQAIAAVVRDASGLVVDGLDHVLLSIHGLPRVIRPPRESGQDVCRMTSPGGCWLRRGRFDSRCDNRGAGRFSDGPDADSNCADFRLQAPPPPRQPQRTPARPILKSPALRISAPARRF